MHAHTSWEISVQVLQESMASFSRPKRLMPPIPKPQTEDPKPQTLNPNVDPTPPITRPSKPLCCSQMGSNDSSDGTPPLRREWMTFVYRCLSFEKHPLELQADLVPGVTGVLRAASRKAYRSSCQIATVFDPYLWPKHAFAVSRSGLATAL